MKKLDVLCLTTNDWCNSMFRYARCLKYLGLNVMAYKGNTHSFKYPEQAAIHTGIINARRKGDIPEQLFVPELRQRAKEAEVIHFFASTFIDCGVDITKKKVVVQHGGTMYRMPPKECNDFFNPFATATIIQYPTLLNLGAKNEHLVYYPVDTDELKPNQEPSKEPHCIRVGHFPSSKEVKGTEKIVRVIEKFEQDPEFKDRFEYVGVRPGDHPGDLVSWYNNLKRIESCDIIIETCQAEYAGKPFGEWGNTALEAAALGKIVVTNTQNKELYEKEYGPLGLYIANDEVELENMLATILMYDANEIFRKKMASRGWVAANHSIPATAKRLWDTVYKDLVARS